ncbi:MAG: hypothetical protein FHP94_18715 [Denitromonas halophila]|nr:MAG: hypothetical protein FHP94_18715 [Denitromonas halophila]TVT74495.1 MAG: hypothetical protein FHP93_03675 [Denitromonas halophila]
MKRMWRRLVILLLILALPLPSLAGWGGVCADAAPIEHAMADMGDAADAPCCPDAGAFSECAQGDCATAAMHFALPVARADLSARAHVLSATPMPGFTSVTVPRHDRPPILTA